MSLMEIKRLREFKAAKEIFDDPNRKLSDVPNAWLGLLKKLKMMDRPMPRKAGHDEDVADGDQPEQ